MGVAYTVNGWSKLWPMDSKRGPMLRYVFLSVFALLLLTACGGKDLDPVLNQNIYKLQNSKECTFCLLIGADLAGTNLRKANLTEANLTEANLTDANLNEAILYLSLIHI